MILMGGLMQAPQNMLLLCRSGGCVPDLTGGGLLAAPSTAAQRVRRPTKSSFVSGCAPEPQAVRQASSSRSPATLCIKQRVARYTL